VHTEIRYRIWPCNAMSSKFSRIAACNTHNISDAAMLLKFCSSKLSHVSPCAFFGDVAGAANNFSPQGQCTLSLNELRNSGQSYRKFRSWQVEEYMIETNRALSSSSQPGSRPGRYCGISSQHSS
jgi:hypothetical protein